MEETKMSEVVTEVKNASEDELRKVTERHFEAVRTGGMKIGAQYISVAIMSKINQHLGKPRKASLRDHERCIADIKKIIAVQLKQQETLQNDLEEVAEEDAHDE